VKYGLVNKLFVRVLPFLVSWLLRLWFATCRVKEHGAAYREEAERGHKAVIAAFWHYSLVYVFYHLRKVSAAVLVSASEDGEYIARLAHHLNFATVRGSSNRRGIRALRELMSCLENGTHVGIVADGSQGPARQAQAGAVLLASRTGSPILPIAWSATRSFIFDSWDRTAIPKPFSRITFFYGKVLWVPAGIDSGGIEDYRLQLEEQLNKLYRQAWSLQDRQAH
jgi:lysophospholipid acyltransferase (LPLAT)-like uncharacterized protein